MTEMPVAVVGVPVTTAMDRGIEWTNGIAGLFVRQKLELLEAISGCETKNKYNIVQLAEGTDIPDKPSSGWTSGLKDQAAYAPLLRAKEQSECMERICCPLFRSFKMEFADAGGTSFFTIDRPFKCDPCYGPPLCACNQQELSVSDKSGNLVANAKEKGGCCTSCCTRSFIVTDASGKEMYTMKAGECGTEKGCNFCAPTCFNDAYTIDIFEDGKFVSESHFIWPGCNCAGLTDRSNFLIVFPKDATPEKRVGLVAGMFLIEYAVNEKKSQDQKNNGGGGGSPASQEMSR
jgi:hypothetical protein